jgi:hypothetical protein
MNAESYLVTLDIQHYKNSIRVKPIEDSELVVSPIEGEVIRLNFATQSEQGNLAYNLLDETTLEMENASSLWYIESGSGDNVIRSKANISNIYGANKNYKIAVVVSKDSIIGVGTLSGLPRLISLNGTSQVALGWYRDGCSSDAFIVMYYNNSSVHQRPRGNLSNFCDNWSLSSDNTVVYEKIEETLRITVNGVAVGEYTDLHPTLNNMTVNAKFLTNIDGYSSNDIYIKSLSVAVSN